MRDEIEPRLGIIGHDAILFSRLRALSARRGWVAGRCRTKAVMGRDMRGLGVAAVLNHAMGTHPHHRRVKFSGRYMVLRGAVRQNMQAHLRYLTRDGKGREGEAPDLYAERSDRVAHQPFVDLTSEHRHQFRFVVEPEDGWEYGSLRGFVRRLMSRVEEDLRVDLDWVAADHFDNGCPHAHIILAGADRGGEDIRIAPIYLRAGFRARAAEIVSLDMGPRPDMVLDHDHEYARERVTDLDRAIWERAGETRRISQFLPDGVEQGRQMRRLIELEALGLAEREGRGVWCLNGDMLTALEKMAERGREWAAMQNWVIRHAPEQSLCATLVWDPRRDEPVIGRLLAADRLPGGETEIILSSTRGESVYARGLTDRHLQSDMVVRLARSGREAGAGLTPEQGSRLEVLILSERAPEHLINVAHKNWLDRVASGEAPVWLGGSFGEDVHQATSMRKHGLHEQGMTREPGLGARARAWLMRGHDHGL